MSGTITLSRAFFFNRSTSIAPINMKSVAVQEGSLARDAMRGEGSQDREVAQGVMYTFCLLFGARSRS